MATGYAVYHLMSAVHQTRVETCDVRYSRASAVIPFDVIPRRNPAHYSGFAQLIGARGVAYVQEELGAKVRLFRFMLGVSCWTTRVGFNDAIDQALE